MNSCAMSTLDCSSALPISVPRPPVPATPTLRHARRLALAVAVRAELHQTLRVVEVRQRELADRHASGRRRRSRRSCRQELIDDVRAPCPAAAPFCVIDEVADGDAKPVSDRRRRWRRRCPTSSVLAAAPLVQVGRGDRHVGRRRAVDVRSARRCASKVSVPVAERGRRAGGAAGDFGAGDGQRRSSTRPAPVFV